MSTVYKSGKKVTTKKTKELRTVDIHNTFVDQLENNFIEFISGVRTVPEKNIPKKLQSLLSKVQKDVFHFVDNYRFTSKTIPWEEGLLKLRGNREHEDEFNYVLELNKIFKKENGSSKWMPLKLVDKNIRLANEERQKNKLPALKEVPKSTYDSWKKRIKSCSLI
jgi:hypothetical protein